MRLKSFSKFQTLLSVLYQGEGIMVVAIDIPRDILLELVKEGKTDKEIGEIIHASESTVQRYRAKYGILKFTKASTYNKDMYLRMKECSLTDDQIAYIWDSKRRNLNNWKYRMGLTNKPQKML